MSQSIAVEIVKKEKGPGEITKTVQRDQTGKLSKAMQEGRKRLCVLNSGKGHSIPKTRTAQKHKEEQQLLYKHQYKAELTY